MTSTDGESPDEAESTRPISVAELLARNGTIGAPPVGGRRRRRRGKDAVTVAELTGEIPVIRDDTPPPQPEPAAEEDVETAVEPVPAEAVSAEMVVVYESATAETGTGEEADETEVGADAAEPVEAVESAEVGEAVESAEVGEAVESAEVAEPAESAEVAEPAEVAETAETAEPAREPSPPLSSDPLPRRGRGPELGHDPRPIRRSDQTGAEQMSFDPVDQAVDLADLVDPEEERKLRSYLKASEGTLFSGDTVADDLARRGLSAGDLIEQPGDADFEGAGQRVAVAVPKNRLHAVRQAAVAVGQSALAVVLGAGLFLGFDQLWRWNTIVALVLSVLVILGLVIAVRVVRRTEDIASTLIAVAVGALVTLGPLALLQSYG